MNLSGSITDDDYDPLEVLVETVMKANKIKELTKQSTEGSKGQSLYLKPNQREHDQAGGPTKTEKQNVNKAAAREVRDNIEGKPVQKP